MTSEGASDPVRSNAYIAQVTESLTGAPPTAVPVQTAQPQPTAKPTAQSQLPAGGTKPTLPDKLPPAQQLPQPKTGPEAKLPSAPVPQTGGSFPIIFAIVLVVITLLARYLRGRSYRRV